MRRSQIFGLILVFALVSVLAAGCARRTTFETVAAPTLPLAGATGTTDDGLPAPTSTPTPTPPPLPTPTPTPTPEYVEPLFEEPVWYNGYVDPRSVRAEIVQNPEDITVLINKYFSMPSDYVPELVSAKSSAGQQLRPEAADAWDAMCAACKAGCGESLYLISGYRSWADQTYSFRHAIERRGIEKVCEKNAYQGRSEHCLGLALDINIAGDPEIRDEFAESAAGRWVNEHGHEYGFIQRYPREKGSITGYGYEAWHYRYVGVELATELYESGQTLEEYYGQAQLMPS